MTDLEFWTEEAKIIQEMTAIAVTLAALKSVKRKKRVDHEIVFYEKLHAKSAEKLQKLQRDELKLKLQEEKDD